MISVSSISPIYSYVRKPVVVNPESLKNLRYVGNVFEKPKQISVAEVKSLFPNGRLDQDNYVVREMNLFKKRVPEGHKFIDLSPNLTENDYELITKMMNLGNGNHINTLKGFSDTDLIPNIQKLALFGRTMKLTRQAEKFLEFNPEQWDIVVEGIVKKPVESIVPLLEYKFDSTAINEALSKGEATVEIANRIKSIENYLKLFDVKKAFKVFRGERKIDILNTIKLPNGKGLGEVLEEFTKNIRERSSEEIEKFKHLYMLNQTVTQSRFLSTAMNKSYDYAKKILWKLEVPAGTKGASIESFNVERKAESEFLMQRGTSMKIKKADFNYDRNIWEFEGTIEQSIDNPFKNVKINVGV